MLTRRAVAAVLLFASAGAGACSEEGEEASSTTLNREGGWETRADAPLALTEVATAAFRGEVWSVGGITAEGTITTAVQIYDPEADSWRDGPELPQPLHHTALVPTDTELVVVGGYRTTRFDPVDEVLVLEEDGSAWRSGPALPSPRGAGAAAWDGSRVVYGGGVTEDGLAAAVLVLDDTEDGEWNEIGALAIARDHLAAASNGDGTVWFLGGRQNDLQRNLDTVDVVAGNEVSVGAAVATPRGGVAAFFSPAHGACLVGGEQPNGTFDEVECTAIDGTTTELPSLARARHGLGAAVVDGVAYVVFGGTEPGLSVSTAVESLPLDNSRQ